MLKHLTFAACLLAVPAAAQDADTVVATVNGTPVTLGQMIAMKRGLQDQAAADLPDPALWDLMLDQMVRQTAVAGVGAAQMDAGDVAALEIDRRAYLASAALERVAEAEPTDAEINAAYEKAFGEAAPKMQYSAAHILVETEEEAKEIKTLLDEGGDFGALAEERSSDSSGPNKGDLGWFTPDQMVKPFADAVVALEKGAVSDPVQSEFGWHIVKLNDTRQLEAPKMDEIRPQIVQQVRRQKVEAEIARLVGEATVEKVEGLDPSLLQRTDLLDAPASVTAPASGAAAPTPAPQAPSAAGAEPDAGAAPAAEAAPAAGAEKTE